MSAAATCAARNNATVKTRTLGQNLKPQTPKTLKLSLSQSLLENTLCPRISLREVKPKQSNPSSFASPGNSYSIFWYHRDKMKEEDSGPPNRELYALLNISPEASDEEIRKAYRQWAQIYHPDKYQELHVCYKLQF